MPYSLSPARNAMAIAECEFSAAQTIQFTPFSSCIGVLARVQNQLHVVGIHLVLVDAQGNHFSANDVQTVVQTLTAANYDLNNVLIIGQIAYWEKSAPAAYQALVQALAPRDTYPLSDGIYGATVDQNGDIELTFQ